MNATAINPPARQTIETRALHEADLPQAERIFRLAFGTFIGLPDPMQFMGDADLVRPRWRAAPEASFAACTGGELVGSNFAANWGSFGFFGPLTVRPDWWGKGVAQRLVEPAMEAFHRWGSAQVGLFTFPHSPLHITLYRKFGFAPRALTAVMSKVPAVNAGGTFFSLRALSDDERRSALAAAFELTDRIHAGLDVRSEMQAALAQSTGDTVMLWDGAAMSAFAVCHYGRGSEAGSGTCYVKFGAAAGAHEFEKLLTACEAFASERGLQRLIAGVNTARVEAYETMFRHGFRIDILGVAMHRPNEAGYNRAGVFVLDDWR